MNYAGLLNCLIIIIIASISRLSSRQQDPVFRLYDAYFGCLRPSLVNECRTLLSSIPTTLNKRPKAWKKKNGTRCGKRTFAGWHQNRNPSVTLDWLIH